MAEFLAELVRRLERAYIPANVEGPHDATHPQRMIRIGALLVSILGFDWQEFCAAVWLHNLDRCTLFQGDIAAEAKEELRRGISPDDPAGRRECKRAGLGFLAGEFLKNSPFTFVQTDRIAEVVANHSAPDKQDDSALLIALRSADRLDWLGPIGIVGAAYFWSQNGAYNSSQPFGQWLNNPQRTAYDDMLRQTEWYGMLPEAVRPIADQFMPARVAFIRALGAEIAVRGGYVNRVEADLARVLGTYYEKWC